MNRQILPNRRPGYNFELKHGGQNAVFHVTIGYFRGTRDPSEVFISGAKAGSEVEAVARDGAVLLSIALQHGASIETIKHAITREQDGTPSTVIGKVVDMLANTKEEDC
jgi:hypothetical protein